jgi:hypothetical protein
MLFITNTPLIKGGTHIHVSPYICISRYTKHGYVVRLHLQWDYMGEPDVWFSVLRIFDNLNCLFAVRHVEFWDWARGSKIATYRIGYGDLFNGSGQLEQYIKCLRLEYQCRL